MAVFVLSLAFTPVAAGAPLLIFVSFSMPPPNLHRLAAEAAKIDASLVLRGLPGESHGEMVKNIHTLAAQAPEVSLVIDPALFEDFMVHRVPVFIWPLSSCGQRTEQGRYRCADGPYLRLAGDVSLDYVLEKMTERGAADDVRRAWLRLRGDSP